MNEISYNLSGKIEPLFIDALLEIKRVARGLGLDFIVVGAAARDIVMEHLYRLRPGRLTKDIDIAVCLASWGEFESLSNALRLSGNFIKGDQKQRFVFKGRDGERIIDIIPFGDIADRESRILWPPEYDTILTTLGFIEILRNATIFKLNDDPVLEVKVPSIPGLAIMKLLAWNEGYPKRDNDAEDLIFIMRNYQEAGIEDRLYDSEAELLKEERFDNELAGIRLLGRDMAKLSSANTAKAIMEILNRETGDVSGFRLANQMARISLDIDSLIFRLEKLKQGFQERFIYS